MAPGPSRRSNRTSPGLFGLGGVPVVEAEDDEDSDGDEDKSEDEKSEEDILQDARDQFSICEEAEAANRREALDDLRFARLNEQWPETVRRQREIEGRPCLTIPRLQTFIRQVVNDARQNRPRISVKPVDSNANVKTAKIYDGIIRNIEHISKADLAYDTGMEFSVSSGLGYWRVSLDYSHDDSFDMDLKIERVANPFSIYGDPMSTAADSSDWNVAFVIEVISRDEFKRKYKGAEDVDWDEEGYKDLDLAWFTEETVTVAEYWTRKEVDRPIVLVADAMGKTMVVEASRYDAAKTGFDMMGYREVVRRVTKSFQVTRRLMTGAEILEEQDWPGKYIPIVPVYGDEVNVEGRRHLLSLIRGAKDAQRMLNYWRTASTELVALAPKAPYIGRVGTFETDNAKWSSANNNNYPYIEFDGEVPPERQPFTGPPAGAIQEALNASDDIKSIMGMYDASLGANGNENSGRMVLARQQQGDRGTFHFVDNLSRSITHTGNILIDLIPKVYNKARIVRVVGEDGTQDLVPVNSPDPTTGSILYDLTVGKYDVVVEAGPSFATRRDEAANQMMTLLHVLPQAAPFIGDLLVKNLDWPGAEEIAQRMQMMQQHQLQMGDQASKQKAMEMQQDLQNQQQVLQMKTQSDLALENAKAQNQQQIEQIKGQVAQMLEQTKAAAASQNFQRQKEIEAQIAIYLAQQNAEVEKQTEQFKAQMAAQVAQSQQQSQQEQFEAQARTEIQSKHLQLQMSQDFEWRKLELENKTKILIAEINAASKTGAAPDPAPLNNDMMRELGVANANALSMVGQGLGAIAESMSRPKTIKRDPVTGATIGLE